MDDRLHAGKPHQYFAELPRPTQPPILSRRRNEHRSQCGDALWLDTGSIKQDGSSHIWINVWVAPWQVKLCDLSSTRVNLSALEMSISHIIKRYANALFTYLLTYLLACIQTAVACRGFLVRQSARVQLPQSPRMTCSRRGSSWPAVC